MKEFKGTKGNWKSVQQFEQPLRTTNEEGDEWYHLNTYIFMDKKVIGEVNYSTSTKGYDIVNRVAEMQANAKLIAAAPELLAALQEFLLLHKVEACTREPWEKVAEKAEQAIEKAL